MTSRDHDLIERAAVCQRGRVAGDDHSVSAGLDGVLCIDCVRALLDEMTADHARILIKNAETMVDQKQRIATLERERVVGFYEEKYPVYADVWTHELQSPVTAEELNASMRAMAAMWRALQLLLVAVAEEPEDSMQGRALAAALVDLQSNTITARLLHDEVAERKQRPS